MTRRIRVVCAKCNNGWLSNLEKRTKPLLIPLIQGDALTLGPNEQKLLATWIAKTTMTVEFVELDKVVAPQAERDLLMETLSPPVTGWWIWIAGNGGIDWATGINHLRGRINIAPITLPAPDAVNVQSTTIGIGRLLIYCISTTFPYREFRLANPTQSNLKLIWPPTENSLPWPPNTFLTDYAINQITVSLNRAFPSITYR